MGYLKFEILQIISWIKTKIFLKESLLDIRKYFQKEKKIELNYSISNIDWFWGHKIYIKFT